jgi:predicted kinase
MPKCTILVGVPASGKSTWIREQLPFGLYGSQVMSTDKIIESITQIFGMSYNDGFKDLIGFADKVMWRQITISLMHKADFVIDRTNLTAKSRAKFIQKLALHRYEIEAIVFPEVGSEALSKEEWKRRLDSRPGKTIPQEALDRMIDSYEIPLMSEGFDKITFM